MNSFIRMVKELWWLILFVIVASGLLTIYISPFFLVFLPMTLIVVVHRVLVLAGQEDEGRR